MPLPSVLWPNVQPGGGSVPPAADLNRTASAAGERIDTILATGRMIPVIYGLTTFGCWPATVIVHGNNLLLLCVISRGEIDAVSLRNIDGEAPAAGVEWTAYAGTDSQPPDPWLVAAFAAQGITYADALHGIAYVVVKVPTGQSAGFPRVVFTVRGRLLFDPRTGTTYYTDNATLALRDFLVDTVFGCAMPVKEALAIVAANANDALVGTAPNQQKHRTIGLAIDKQDSPEAWINTLRAYAGVFVDRSGPEALLVPDAPCEVEMSFNGDNIVEGSIRLRKRGVAGTPTVVRLAWSDPDKDFASSEVEVALPGVETGEIDRRESTVSMLGITRYAQAVREATERLNKLQLTDLEGSFLTFDVGLKLLAGTVIDISDLIGLTLKPVRVTDLRIRGGNWEVLFTEYDPAVYCLSVTTTPTTPDTLLPSPLDLPAIAGLSVTETYLTEATGVTSSCMSVTWAGADYTYLDGYRAELWDGETLVESATVFTPEWRTGRVLQGVLYGIRVQALSIFTTSGPWSDYCMIKALGKLMRPTDVARVWGFEVGGEVRLQCTPSIDIDERRYEYRWGVVGVDWEDAKIIDRVDGLRLSVNTIPVGTWDFLVKALDSTRTPAEPYGQYSLNAARCTIEVTLDTAAYLVDEHAFVTPTVSGMIESNVRRSDTVRRFVTSDGVPAAEVFTGPLSDYPNRAATYHGLVDSVLVSESVDFGTQLAGNWHGQTGAVAINGSLAESIELSPNAVTYTPYGIDAKAAGRFARLRVTAEGDSTVVATVPTLSLRVDATPRKQYISGDTLVSGGLLISIPQEVVAFLSFNYMAIGASGKVAWRTDALTLGDSASFRVYAFDSATQAQISVNFKGEVNFV